MLVSAVAESGREQPNACRFIEFGRKGVSQPEDRPEWIVSDQPQHGVQIRAAEATDGAFLEEMLLEAFFWTDDVARPPLSRVREQPEFARIFAGWGRHGDRALVAITHDSERVGAAWSRLWTPADHSYGFVSADVPELGIAVVAAYRSKGIGRSLLQALIAAARSDGCPGISLSVSPQNRARGLYESEGFRKVGESGTSWTLLCTWPRRRAAV